MLKNIGTLVWCFVFKSWCCHFQFWSCGPYYLPCLISFLSFFKNFIYLFIYGCVGSSFPCEDFLQLQQAGATLHRGARASHYRSLSCCGAQAPDAQAQQLWLTGLVPLRHVGSSQTRARTRVPRIGRQTPNHCASREAPIIFKLDSYSVYLKTLG